MAIAAGCTGSDGEGQQEQADHPSGESSDAALGQTVPQQGEQQGKQSQGQQAGQQPGAVFQLSQQQGGKKPAQAGYDAGVSLPRLSGQGKTVAIYRVFLIQCPEQSPVISVVQTEIVRGLGPGRRGEKQGPDQGSKEETEETTAASTGKASSSTPVLAASSILKAAAPCPASRHS